MVGYPGACDDLAAVAARGYLHDDPLLVNVKVERLRAAAEQAGGELRSVPDNPIGQRSKPLREGWIVDPDQCPEQARSHAARRPVELEGIKPMTYGLKRGITLLPLLAPVLLGACVSQSAYDALQQQNQQLQQQNQQLQTQLADAQAHVTRLQGAIKYTVNSDLLFSSGSFEVSDQGKRIIANLASKLAPTQTEKLVVNGYTDNAQIGRALRRQGITSNQELSQRRAESVMNFMISQGVKPNLVSAQGHGDSDPVASNATAAGREQNRRVEITLAGPAS